uniref:HAT C-terminal dimerisation domain-containing protein n=1 Tax=Ditylenchus dipsaci TaxID=166011 RepID=A0A915DU11_9BILA
MGKAFKDVFEVDVNLQFLDEDEDCEFDGIDDENTTENIPEVDVIICSAFPLRVKCVAHSLQLAIVDEFRMCVLPSSAYSKMMDVVRAFRKSPLAIQELDEATGKALLSVSNTRWSYQILGIQRYLELEEDVRAIAKSRNMNPPTSIEVEFLRQVHSLMKMFVDVLRRVQTEKSVSISLCYGYLKTIYDSLVRFKQNSSSPAIADKLEEIMDKRFECFMNPDSLDFDPLFLMAAVFDPNTAWQLSEEDFNVAVNSIQNLIRFEQPEVMEEPASVVCLDATLDRLMEEYARKQASQRKQKEPNRGKSWVVQILQRTSLIETEVQPVAKLALEVLSVSISSAPVERIFSQAGLATARHRNRTKLDLLNSQLFIHCNRNV